MAIKKSKPGTTTRKLPALQASHTAPKFERHSITERPSTDNSSASSPSSAASQPTGQLSLDVYDSPTELIIIAPIAGVKLEDVSLSVTEDILTVSGKRHLEFHVPGDDYLIQECFWGEFSRSIVLPDHVDSSRISASFKDGILRISIPKNPGADSHTKLIKIKSS